MYEKTHLVLKFYNEALSNKNSKLKK